MKNLQLISKNWKNKENKGLANFPWSVFMEYMEV